MIFSSMSLAQVTNPRSIITVIAPLLAKGGELKGNDEAISLLDHMKEATVLVQKVIYLNILTHTTNKQVLTTYLTSGGWDLLNTWLTDTRKLDNIALAHEILKVLKHLPVTLDLLKQGNMGKIVKVFTKSESKGESVGAVKELSSELLSHWKQVVAQGCNKKKGGERSRDKEISKKDQLVPKKDSSSSKSTHIAESGGFLDAITQKAPQPRKVRKRNSGDDFKRSVSESKDEKKPEPLKIEKVPSPPSPPPDRATFCLTNSPPPLPEKSHGNDNMFSFRKAKKRRRIRWRDTIGGEEGLEEVQYFECDQSERTNSAGTFTDSALKEHEMEKLGLLRSRQLGDDMMVEQLDYRHPLPLEHPTYKNDLGQNSKERAIQKDRERNVLAMLILDPSNIPESPSEPDPELDLMPKEEPKVIPLVDIQESENNQPISTPSPQQPPENLLALPAALANILATPSEPLPEPLPPALEPPHPPEFPANIQRYPHQPQGFPPAYNPADFSYAFAPPPLPANTEYRDYNRDREDRPHRDDRHRDDRHDRYNDRRDRYKRDDRDRRGRDKICNFFSMPRGCRLGNKCSFLHVGPETQSHNGRDRVRERDSTFT